METHGCFILNSWNNWAKDRIKLERVIEIPAKETESKLKRELKSAETELLKLSQYAIRRSSSFLRTAPTNFSQLSWVPLNIIIYIWKFSIILCKKTDIYPSMSAESDAFSSMLLRWRDLQWRKLCTIAYIIIILFIIYIFSLLLKYLLMFFHSFN